MVKEDLWERSVGEGLRYVRTYVRKSCGRQAALEAQLKASHVFFVLVRTSCLHERAYVRSAMCARQFGSSSGAIAFVQATCAHTYARTYVRTTIHPGRGSWSALVAMPTARRQSVNGPVRIVRSSVRDMISDGFIKRVGLHVGAPLRPTTEEITAYEDEAARREGQVPEATSQVVLPLSQEDIFEGDVPSTPKTDKSKAAREANVTPWRAGCYVPSPPCNDLFGPTDFYEEEKKLEASAAAFAKWWKEAPRPRRKKRTCTDNFAITGWLPKLRKFVASTDTQETQETQETQSLGQDTQSLGLF